METDASYAECGRAFQLFPQTGTGSAQLGWILRGGVQHVGRVHYHVLQRNTCLGEGGSKPLDPFRTNRRLVAVVLGRRSEDLERPRARGRGAKRCHVNATVWHRVNTDEVRQDLVSPTVTPGTAICGRHRDS
jgi:hypothetical protein